MVPYVDAIFHNVSPSFTSYVFLGLLAANAGKLSSRNISKNKRRGTRCAQELFNQCENFTKENEYAHMGWVTATDNYVPKDFMKRWVFSRKLGEIFKITQKDLLSEDTAKHLHFLEETPFWAFFC